MRELSHIDVYSIMDSMNELNNSELRLSDFLLLEKNVTNPLKIFNNITFFNPNSFEFSEYYSIRFKSNDLTFIFSLIRESGVYRLSLYKSSLSHSLIYRKHKMVYVEAKFKKYPFLLKYIKTLSVERTSIKTFDESLEKIEYILSVLKNKRLNQFFYCNNTDKFSIYHMHFKNLMNNLDDNPDLIELSKRNNKTFHYEHSSYSFFNLIGFLFINFKTNQFIQKEFSQNKKLVDQDLYNKIFLIYNSETLLPKFEKDIIPKISGFKSYTVLDQGITSFINISNNWNLNYFKTEFYKKNLDFYSPKKNILILKLENFETCVNFCPPSWCIKKDKRLLDNRISSKENIYLILNFNYTSIESLSMVGITLDRNLHIVERYDKFNKSFIQDPYSIRVKHYISKLISRKKLYKKIKPLTSFFKKIFLLK